MSLGIECRPITIHQDNKSTIIIAKGTTNVKRTKHLVVRESYVKKSLEKGDMILKYLPTKLMKADFLTKPMSGPKMSELLRNIEIINISNKELVHHIVVFVVLSIITLHINNKRSTVYTKTVFNQVQIYK